MADEKIGTKASVEITLTCLAQLVPVVGSAATWWSSYKQERTNRRLENLISELSEDIERLKEEGVELSEEGAATVASLVEATFDRVETELNEEKIKYFKKFLKSTLLSPDPNDIDKKKMLLDELASMSTLECGIVATLYKTPNYVPIGFFTGPLDIDIYTALGAINRLKSRGFIAARRGSYMMNGNQDEALTELVSISSYGKTFTEFCILD